MDYKSILVTGGSGFIASNFVNYMVEKYPDTLFINFDALYYCASNNNIEVSNKSNYKFIKGNINSIDLLNFVLEDNNVDCIMHFAAQSHVDNSFSGPLQYTKDNVMGTHNLLEACRKYGKIKRFIHVSTDEVYGESELDENKKNEASVLCPTNPYAASKAGAELIARAYMRSFKLPIIITRGNNVYGKRQYPEKLIPKFICLLNQNKKCTIHGIGNAIRAFLNVKDVVKAFEIVLLKGKNHEIYNIGCDMEHSVLNVAHKLIEIMKPKDKVEDWITIVRDREFNDQRYFICSKKLESLGWKPEISFEKGLKECIEWYTNKIIPKKHWDHKNNVNSIF